MILAAVDGQRRAGDEAGFVGDQEEHGARDLLDFASRPTGISGRMVFSRTSFGTALTISVAI